MKNGIEFFEKPVTDDEKDVAALLQKIAQAVIVKDIDLLVSAYSNNASIENLSSGDTPLNKNEYKFQMLKDIENIRDINFRDTVVRVNGQEAAISCLSIISLRDKIFPIKNRRYYKCIKKYDKWSIVESRYVFL